MDAPVPRGTLIGNRWRVNRELGEGGFGRVFEAADESDISLGQAAVKLLHPNISPQERNAFLAEVKRIANLRHPNLVGYLDSGTQEFDGEIHPYLVTELCIGSLADRVDAMPDRKLPSSEMLAILADVTAGLDHLHQRSMIHRDIKPGNVLYAGGNWKLSDFGLTRDLTATGTYHRSSQLTGTPVFMAPELFSTMTATAPSDIYAVGVMAHLATTGRALHSGSGAALVHQITSSPPDIDPSLHAGLREFIRRATDIEPGNRPTARELNEMATSQQAEAATTEKLQQMTQVAPTATTPMSPKPAPPPNGAPPAAPTGASGDQPWHPSDPTISVGGQAPGAAPSGAVPSSPMPSSPMPSSPMPSSSMPSGPVSGPTASGPPPVGHYAAGHPSGPIDEGQGRSIVPAVVAAASVALIALIGLLFLQSRGDSSDPDTVAADGQNTTTPSGADDTETTDSTDGTDGTEAGSTDDSEASTASSIDNTPSVQPVETVESSGGAPIDLSSPVVIEGAIEVALDTHSYPFDASAGDEVSLEILGLNGVCDINDRWDLELRLLNPSGELVGDEVDNPSCGDGYGPWVLSSDGEHTLAVSGAGGSSSRPPTGSYEIQAAKLLKETTAVDLSSPVSINGGIVVARDRQSFTFDADAGNRVSVQIDSINDVCESSAVWDMEIFVEGPSGEPVDDKVFDNLRCGEAIGPWDLPSDGEYALVVRGGEGSSSRPTTGTFGLTLARLQG